MKIDKDSKYFSLAFHIFLAIAASMIFYMLLQHYASVKGWFNNIIKVFNPFIFAFMIAYLLNPIMVFLEKKLLSRIRFLKIKKWLIRVFSIVITYALAIVLLSLLVYIVIPQFAISIYGIAKNISVYAQKIEDVFNYSIIPFINSLPFASKIDPNFITDWVNNFTSSSDLYLSKILPVLYNATLAVTISIKNAVLAFIISIYMLGNKERYIAQSKKVLFSLLSTKRAASAIRLLRLINLKFGGFISGKIIDSIIIGFLCFVGMWIFRIDYAILISVIIGVTNVIPYFGPFIGAIPSIIILLFVSPVKALIFAVFILVLQQFDGNILGPKILGDSIGLTSFWVIFAVILFGGFFNVIGMFLGVPIFAVIYALFNEYVRNSLEKKKLAVETVQYYDCDDSPPPADRESE